jgi:hypothetical protein
MNKPELARAFVAGNNGTCHNATTDGQTYWLHGHPIAVKTDGAVVFYWHGYYTVTTASHMNEVLKALGAPFRVSRSTAAKEGQTHFVYNPTRPTGPKD